MRPTFDEQLAGLRRILADVVGPAVDAPYPAEVLRSTIASLDMLSHAYVKVAPFLAWDNHATEALLADVAPRVGGDLAARIETALAARPVDPLDTGALDARNVEVRGLLVDAIAPLAGGGGATSSTYAAVCAHLRERVNRYPFAMTASLPTK